MDKIRIGLGLGGGGGRGSYHAGVVKWLDEHNDRFEIVAVTGTSVGALNGALIASGNIPKLIELWLNVSHSNSFFPNYKPFGIPQGLMFEKSLFSNRWLKKALKENINLDSFINSEIDFGAVYVDLNSSDRQTKMVTNKEQDKDILLDGILASATLFPAFPPVKLRDATAVDGGFRNPLPIKEVLEISSKPLDKVVIVPCISTNFTESKPVEFLEIFNRIIDIFFDNAAMLSMQNGKKKYWVNDDKFILLEPHLDLCGTFELEPEKHILNIQHGYDRAKEVLGKLI